MSDESKGRTGAIDLEPFDFAQGKLLPLLDSILKHWSPATFDPEILIRKAENDPTNYVF